jgi:hypothetical protein
MKKFAALTFAFLLFAACKKDPPVDASQQLSERLPGTWNVTEIQYNGTAPNPFDATQTLAFSGAGKNVNGYFYFDKDTNLGEFDISFIAEADLGLGAPVSYNAITKRGGYYEIMNNDAIVRMTNFVGDSVFDWEVRVNQAQRQVWFVTMYHDWGLPGLDSVPINVEATMTR